MINEQIRDKEVRLISADGEQLGIMSSRDAMKLAQEAELDLVKIAPGAKPPVCKIIDYGKYKYEQTRKEKEAKKKQKTVEIKEVRLSPNIDTNDLNTKMNNAKKFISKGNKVKVTLRFRGREMAHVQQSKHILDDFAETLADVAVVEKPAKMEGRAMSEETITRTAVVTGGSRGIGREICLMLARSGYYVLINYRSNADEAQRTLEGVRAAGGDGETLRFDVAAGEETAAAIAAWQERHKGAVIEVVVNNAGIRDDVLMMWMEPQQWHSVIGTSLDGFYNVTRPLLKGPREVRWASSTQT